MRSRTNPSRMARLRCAAAAAVLALAPSCATPYVWGHGPLAMIEPPARTKIRLDELGWWGEQPGLTLLRIGMTPPALVVDAVTAPVWIYLYAGFAWVWITERAAPCKGDGDETSGPGGGSEPRSQ